VRNSKFHGITARISERTLSCEKLDVHEKMLFWLERKK